MTPARTGCAHAPVQGFLCFIFGRLPAREAGLARTSGGLMRKTLIATAVSVAIFGPAWAGDITQTSAAGDDTLTATNTETSTDTNTVTATDIGNDKSTGDN